MSGKGVLSTPSKKPNARLDDLYVRGPQMGEPGHFGHCIQVTRISDNKPLACKIIQKSRFVSNGGLEQFKKEVQIMSRLRHPNTIDFEDYLEDEENIYVIMERCNGGELFSQIRNFGSYNEQNASYLFRQLVSAVHHLHKNDILHGDIKPDNILFLDVPENRPKNSQSNDKTENSEENPKQHVSLSSPQMEYNPGVLKLVDYGLAKFVRKGRFFTKFCGTLTYAAPEVHRGAYSTASDMWSLGVVLFVMIYGFGPFQPMGRTANEPIDKIVCGGFYPHEKQGYGPWFPASMPRSALCRDLISRLLERDAAIRLTASEALLHPWLTSAPVATCPYDPLLLSSIKRFQANSVLKTHLIRLFSRCLLSEADIQQLKYQFKQMDSDGDGHVSADEIFAVAKAVSLLLPEGKLAAESERHKQEQEEQLKKHIHTKQSVIATSPSLMSSRALDAFEAVSEPSSIGSKRNLSLLDAERSVQDGEEQKTIAISYESSSLMPEIKKARVQSEIEETKRPSSAEDPQLVNIWNNPINVSTSTFEFSSDNLPSYNAMSSISSSESLPVIDRLASAGTVAMHEPLRDMIGWTVKASLEDIHAIIKRLDMDGDGRLSFEEVVAAAVHAKLMAKEERLWKIFRAMDSNNDGVLSVDEIKDALVGCGMSLKTKVKKRRRKPKDIPAKIVKLDDMKSANNDESVLSRGTYRHQNRRRSSVGILKDIALKNITDAAWGNNESESDDEVEWEEYEVELSEEDVFRPHLNSDGLVQYDRFLDLMEFIDFDLSNAFLSDLGI